MRGFAFASFRAAFFGALGFASLAAGCGRSPAMPIDHGPSAPIVEYVTEQEILTHLPMRVRLPESYGAERVLVFVHLWGSRHWDTIELARDGQTWEGAVSCRAVSTVTGDTRYFFLALDPEGQVVAGSGSPEWPHVVTVVRELSEGARSLSGQAPPLRCHDPADCPPDFPGCPAYAIVRGKCRTSDDCENGARCTWEGYCEGAVEPIDEGATEDELLAAAVRKATKRYRTAKATTRPLR